MAHRRQEVTLGVIGLLCFLVGLGGNQAQELFLLEALDQLQGGEAITRP